MNRRYSLLSVSKRSVLICLLLCLSGCASEPAGYADSDPLEPLNRAVYGFNSFLDKVMLRPLALGYAELTPDPLQKGVSNVYSNLLEPTNSINQLLQGKPRMAGNSLGRFAINSSIGIFGIFDVAGNADFAQGTDPKGLRRQEEDFGQTLATWGIPAGPYLVLPLLGPSSLRDGPALVADAVTNPGFYLANSSMKDKLLVLRIIDLRTSLLPLDEILERSSDQYAFTRSAFRQNREFQIWDGNPPLDENLYDEEFD